MALAGRLTHPDSQAHAFTHAEEVYLLRREGHEAQALAQRAITLAEAKGFLHWRAWGMILLGAALAEQGRYEAGISEMRRGLAAYEAMGRRRGLRL